ncbi:hypothetical protein TNCV_4257931 [Trichonephila clavipes]|nr:hypothetical protein TNCV_4257931 [Trichonephila clavipes]
MQIAHRLVPEVEDRAIFSILRELELKKFERHNFWKQRPPLDGSTNRGVATAVSMIRGTQFLRAPKPISNANTDDELVTSVHEESNPVDDEMDEGEDNSNNKSSKGPSNADAFSALKTAMEWY